MSIIYDYLKQIHEQKETRKVAPEVSPVKKGSPYFFWIKIAVGVLGCLLLGAGLYFFLSKPPKAITKTYRAPVSAPESKTEKNNSKCILEGIIYNPSRPFAIINSKMLEVSSKIGDFEVTQITPDSVTLKDMKDDTSRTIRL
jgi:hypothetical protein